MYIEIKTHLLSLHRLIQTEESLLFGCSPEELVIFFFFISRCDYMNVFRPHAQFAPSTHCWTPKTTFSWEFKHLM